MTMGESSQSSYVIFTITIVRTLTSEDNGFHPSSRAGQAFFPDHAPALQARLGFRKSRNPAKRDVRALSTSGRRPATGMKVSLPRLTFLSCAIIAISVIVIRQPFLGKSRYNPANGFGRLDLGK